MHPDLAPLVASIEIQTARVLALVEAGPDRAERGSWTRMDTLRHLLRVEEMTTAEIVGPHERVARRPPAVTVSLLVWAMRRAVPLPAPSSGHPEGDDDLATLRERLNLLREPFLARVAEAEPGEIVSAHPPFGGLSARQALDLLDSHLTYHLKRPPFVETP